MGIDGKYQNEWLIIKYNKFTKEVQRNNKDIKPYKSDDVLSLHVGSKCLILSDYADKCWYQGKIISIANDDEGEWLKVKYTEHEIEKEVDIQRFSEQITTFNTTNYNKLIVESKQNEDEKQEIRIKALYKNYEWNEVKDLLSIFANILKNPFNAKYRNININKIKHKYQTNPLCVELLFDSGFKKSDNGKQLVFDIKDIKLLNKTDKALKKQFYEMAEIVQSPQVVVSKIDQIRAERICEAIAKYYDFFKQGESYTKTFSIWFADQDDFVDAEIDNVVICCYLQFDQSLPIPNKFKRFEEEVQFEVLRYCFKWYTPPPLDQISQFYHKIEDRQAAYEFMKNMPTFDEILSTFY